MGGAVEEDCWAPRLWTAAEAVATAPSLKGCGSDPTVRPSQNARGLSARPPATGEPDSTPRCRSWPCSHGTAYTEQA